MPLLLDQDGARAERWTLAGAEGPLPEADGLIVPPDRLDEALGHGPAVLGVSLSSDSDPAALASRFDRLALIRIVFPSFSDGRGFSLARRLRAMGYAGRLRAAGPVIADQFSHLLGVGFDEVEVPDEIARRQPLSQWMAARHRISRGYQRRPGAASIAEARRTARS